ncbi:AAA family ATPase [Maritalea mediterranea]|uniref:AAA family ATPase n=1 Tax=Maritalea mediterranea TaxID=2909667 RepID=A0ABS9EC36_9HYPH|nr:AAA family ATPase [Maritalea mediterranea]MCF4099729.1 AAA family ATPase [Maritalea mediterranea]
MYLQRIELTNAGPIKKLNLTCRFSDDGDPLPIAIVGTNGSGKSNLLAHVVNGLIGAQASIFDDADVEQGKVYKLRSSTFIQHGKPYSMAGVEFTNGTKIAEIQLTSVKKDFKGKVEEYEKWEQISPDESSHYSSNLQQIKEETRADLNTTSNLYFPPNRFEEPAWLNELNLKNRPLYNTDKKFQGISNRPVVQYSPLKQIQDWLLDLIYDSHAIEGHKIIIPDLSNNGALVEQQVRNGPASDILEQIERFIRVLFEKPDGKFEWNVGSRNRRSIGVIIDDDVIIGNLFSLSTGQTAILDLFLSLMRDFDISNAEFRSLSDVKGMVVVDEIDLHLHSDYQHDLLPQLMKLFPRVQFIITTHSPLFLLGMKETYGSDGFQLLNLPEGEEIDVERFSEFESAYKYLKDSATFQDEIRKNLDEAVKFTLYVEGDTDIDYLNTAANLLGKTEVLDRFELINAGGQSNLDKVWKAYNSKLAEAIRTKWVLLYDCDTQKSHASNKNILFRRVVPQQNHKINKGIENLFSDNTIMKARKSKPEFIDIVGKHTIVDRGNETTVPEKWSINVNEKRNLCDWFCENGDVDDFKNFLAVFDMLEEIVQA